MMSDVIAHTDNRYIMGYCNSFCSYKNLPWSEIQCLRENSLDHNNSSVRRYIPIQLFFSPFHIIAVSLLSPIILCSPQLTPIR